MRPRRRWGKRTIGMISALSVVSAGTFAGSSVAQSSAAPACPPAMPVAQVHAGMTGTGYTVSRGTVPEPFEV